MYRYSHYELACTFVCTYTGFYVYFHVSIPCVYNMYVCLYTCIYMHIHLRICPYMHTSMYIFMYTYMCIHICICVYMRVYTYIHGNCESINKRMYICIYMHTYIYTHRLTHMNACPHNADGGVGFEFGTIQAERGAAKLVYAKAWISASLTASASLNVQVRACACLSPWLTRPTAFQSKGFVHLSLTKSAVAPDIFVYLNVYLCAHVFEYICMYICMHVHVYDLEARMRL